MLVCKDIAYSALEDGAIFCLDDPKTVGDAISDRHSVTLVLGEVHLASPAALWAAEVFVPSIDHRRLLFCLTYDGDCDRRCTKMNTTENSFGTGGLSYRPYFGDCKPCELVKYCK